jgi:hypothetical protein
MTQTVRAGATGRCRRTGPGRMRPAPRPDLDLAHRSALPKTSHRLDGLGSPVDRAGGLARKSWIAGGSGPVGSADICERPRCSSSVRALGWTGMRGQLSAVPWTWRLGRCASGGWCPRRRPCCPGRGSCRRRWRWLERWGDRARPGPAFVDGRGAVCGGSAVEVATSGWGPDQDRCAGRAAPGPAAADGSDRGGAGTQRESGSRAGPGPGPRGRAR